MGVAVTIGGDDGRCHFSHYFDAVITRMKVRSEKRMELSLTIASLSGSIGMEKGCQPSSQIERKPKGGIP